MWHMAMTAELMADRVTDPRAHAAESHDRHPGAKLRTEAGVEILAQPPGKRLGNVNLMSGGEKALSAIALLFAIFRYQPSPFCLLDEVDAALDEANVGRFTRMLAEYAVETQFVIVTHNKITMEAADLLYGVTMEEPGVSKLVSLQLAES